VVLLSGLGEREVLARYGGPGVLGFVPKPFTRDELLAPVRAALSPG
jgi:hypothetical protein